MKHFLATFHFSMRLASKSPASFILSIFVLAACVTLSASMFRLCHKAFLWNYPYANADSMVILQYTNIEGDTRPNWNFQDVDAITQECGDSFSMILPVTHWSGAIRIGKTNIMGSFAYIGWDYEKMLDVKPLLGRGFSKEDSLTNAEPVALISEPFWRNYLKADPSVIGTQIIVGRATRTIIGIMPKTFDFPTNLQTWACDAWLPFDKDTVTRETGWVQFASLFGLLREGVSYDVAQKSFREHVKQIIANIPDANKEVKEASLRHYNGSFMFESLKKIILVTAICSLLVLLMGCAIVSGLLTARYATRTQELAIRSALGASRGQLVRQMIAEFIIISASSLVLGLLADHWLENAILGKYYRFFPLPSYAQNAGTGWMVFFSITLLMLVTFISSIIPAMRASKTDIGSVLKESTRTGSSLRMTKLSNILIVWQVAVAFTILFSGAVFSITIYKLNHQELYYNPEEYLCASMSLDAPGLEDDANKTRACNQILSILRQNPQIEKTCLSTEIFNDNSGGKSQWGSKGKIYIDGASYLTEDDVPMEMYRVVSSGYFDAMNVPILQGRDFDDGDRADGVHAAAVTDTFARKYYGTTDVLGRKLRLYSGNSSPYTITTVVPDIFNPSNDPSERTGIFLPYAVSPWYEIPIFVKGHGDPKQYEKLLRDTVSSVNDKILIYKVMTLKEVRDYHGYGMLLKMIFTFLGSCAVGILAMSAAGLFGIISLSVSMRRVETGIRLALGADPLLLILQIARRGLICIALGLCIGIPCTICVQTVLTSIFAIFFNSWVTYALAALLVTSIALAATFIPAIRGVHREPAAALHE